MPSSLYQELNRSVHSMQSRVADLIERVQDEIILESTLQINDELNSVFVRYERSEYTGTSSEPASTHDSVCLQIPAQPRSFAAACAGGSCRDN